MTTGWQPAQAYPDPAIITLDPRFEAIRPPMNAAVERLYTGCRWSEGPVWIGDMRCLLWSDIPNNRILKWDEETGEVSVFRKPSNNANGNTRDRQGRLVTCEHLTRQVTRTEHDGSITVICNRFEHKPLNSPNDVVVKSDGSVWFTDPTFGIGGNYEGHRAEPELPTNVYLGDGTPDGFRCDVQGNLWCGWGMSEALNGVAVFAPDGTMIGRISLPERCANLCFGGVKRNRLFMAASQSLYAVYVNTEGAVGG